MRALIAATAILLASCASPQNSEKALLISCAAWDSTLRTLAAYRAADRLSDEDIAEVEAARPILNAACTGNVEPDAALLDRVERTLERMIFIKESVDE